MQVFVIDQNDNPPIFNDGERKRIELIENAPIGWLFLHVKATDIDARDTFE